MQILEILLYSAIFLGVFLLTFGPGFAISFFGEVPVFHKYHLIAAGIALIFTMALFGILLGFLVWLILLPYYFLGACIGYLARSGELF